MKHQQGIPREQLQMLSFDSMISPENPVRFIDSFVDNLDLSKLNFSSTCSLKRRTSLAPVFVVI